MQSPALNVYRVGLTDAATAVAGLLGADDDDQKAAAFAGIEALHLLGFDPIKCADASAQLTAATRPERLPRDTIAAAVAFRLAGLITMQHVVTGQGSLCIPAALDVDAVESFTVTH